jgi:hypothetical protein
LLAGICPADIHNPAPQEWPLLQAGATIVGDGILAVSEDARVVFCQVPPDRVNRTLGSAPSEQLNLKRTYRHTCFLLTRLLGNLGVSGSTPLLTRFSTPVETATEATLIQRGDSEGDSDKDGGLDERPLKVGKDSIPDPTVGRWLEGFYLDVPTEWDDPYRFFRW